LISGDLQQKLSGEFNFGLCQSSRTRTLYVTQTE